MSLNPNLNDAICDITTYISAKLSFLGIKNFSFCSNLRLTVTICNPRVLNFNFDIPGFAIDQIVSEI